MLNIAPNWSTRQWAKQKIVYFEIFLNRTGNKSKNFPYIIQCNVKTVLDDCYLYNTGIKHGHINSNNGNSNKGKGKSMALTEPSHQDDTVVQDSMTKLTLSVPMETKTGHQNHTDPSPPTVNFVRMRVHVWSRLQISTSFSSYWIVESENWSSTNQKARYLYLRTLL